MPDGHGARAGSTYALPEHLSPRRAGAVLRRRRRARRTGRPPLQVCRGAGCPGAGPPCARRRWRPWHLGDLAVTAGLGREDSGVRWARLVGPGTSRLDHGLGADRPRGRASRRAGRPGRARRAVPARRGPRRRRGGGLSWPWRPPPL